MQYGDLSNKRGPAVIINADLLVELKSKFFGLRYEIKFLLSTRHLLESWFVDNDLSIYIVCIGEYAKQVKEIENMLDTFMTPYTSIQVVNNPSELNYLVTAKHIVGYFYHSTTLVDERTELRKHYQVPNLAEISYILEGGNYDRGNK
jgi:hypothetical protein